MQEYKQLTYLGGLLYGIAVAVIVVGVLMLRYAASHVTADEEHTKQQLDEEGHLYEQMPTVCSPSPDQLRISGDHDTYDHDSP